MSGEPAGGKQEGQGTPSKEQAPAPPKATIASHGESSAENADEGKGQARTQRENPTRLALGHFWRSVRHTKLTDWLIILLTAVIAYSTYSSDKTFERQLEQMRASGDQTDHAIEASLQNGGTLAYQAALTARALKLAEDTNATAKDSEGRQLRAYIALTHAQIDNFAVGSPITFTLTARNGGQTPGLNCRGKEKVDFVTRDGRRVRGTLTRDVSKERRPLLSEADYIMSLRWRAPVTKAEADLIASGEGWFEIYGAIKYDDVFGGHQTTHFRLRYRGEGVTLSPAENGNDAT